MRKHFYDFLSPFIRIGIDRISPYIKESLSVHNSILYWQCLWFNENPKDEHTSIDTLIYRICHIKQIVYFIHSRKTVYVQECGITPPA